MTQILTIKAATVAISGEKPNNLATFATLNFKEIEAKGAIHIPDTTSQVITVLGSPKELEILASCKSGHAMPVTTFIVEGKGQFRVYSVADSILKTL